MEKKEKAIFLFSGEKLKLISWIQTKHLKNYSHQLSMSCIKRGSVVALAFEYSLNMRTAKVLSKQKNGWLKARYLTPQEFAGRVVMVRNSPEHVVLLDEYLVSLDYVKQMIIKCLGLDRDKTPERVRRQPQDMSPPPLVRQNAHWPQLR